MSAVYTLVKRNFKLFIRDKATVFFSFLSTLVIIALYFLFIAKMYTSEIGNPDFDGVAASLTENAKFFIVYLQMFAGVLVLNSMSLATGTYTTIAYDFENKHVDSFMLTPARVHEIIISYFTTGLITSFGINSISWLLCSILIGAVTSFWVTAGTFFMILLILFVSSLISSSIMLLVTAFVKSSAAIGVINGVIGTFFGFLCGIYMPYSNLGEGIKKVGSFIPFTHLTIWLKRVMLNDAFSQLNVTGEFKEILLRDLFSANSVGFIGISAPLWLMVLFSGLIGLLCLTASCLLLRKRFKR